MVDLDTRIKDILHTVIQMLRHDNINNIKFYLKYFESGSSVVVDLYQVSRMFKRPEDSNVSSLMISYMGESHIMSLVHYLTDITGLYRIEYSYDSCFKNPKNKNMLSREVGFSYQRRCIEYSNVYDIDTWLGEL